MQYQFEIHSLLLLFLSDPFFVQVMMRLERSLRMHVFGIMTDLQVQKLQEHIEGPDTALPVHSYICLFTPSSFMFKFPYGYINIIP